MKWGLAVTVGEVVVDADRAGCNRLVTFVVKVMLRPEDRFLAGHDL